MLKQKRASTSVSSRMQIRCIKLKVSTQSGNDCGNEDDILDCRHYRFSLRLDTDLSFAAYDASLHGAM
jgi:hypothetical protein